jgi:hypothetical protein
VGGVAVKIRPPGYEKAKLAGERAVFRLGGDVVFGMPRLEGVESHRNERRDQFVMMPQSGMRQRCEAAGVVHDADDLRGICAEARHIGGRTGFEEAIECLVDRAHVAGVQKRDGNLGAPDAFSARGGVENGIHINGTPERSEPGAHLADAPQPVVALMEQESLQGRRLGIDEVPEDVEVAAVLHGADLDPGDQLDAFSACGAGGGGEAARGVVVGDAENGKARSAGP